MNNYSSKYEEIMARYLNGYITEEQLIAYKELGVITEEEYQTIYDAKHNPVPPNSEVE